MKKFISIILTLTLLLSCYLFSSCDNICGTELDTTTTTETVVLGEIDYTKIIFIEPYEGAYKEDYPLNRGNFRRMLSDFLNDLCSCYSHDCRSFGTQPVTIVFSPYGVRESETLDAHNITFNELASKIEELTRYPEIEEIRIKYHMCDDVDA